MRKKIFVYFLLFTIILSPLSVRGQNQLPLQASAAILVEQTTGRVLYSSNAHAQMYPASTTKLLTALLVERHLDLDEIIVIGQEIRGMPAGFATNLHAEGETITVRVLLKAMLIRSSNEAGRILALEVIRTVDGRRNISYSDAKPRFSNLMNEKAYSLGAVNSNFNNPYGLHSEAHFTTAYDLALIARAFMNVPVLMEIAGMRYFEGDSLGGRYYPGANVRQYSWTNTNLMLPGAAFGHPYILGGRTGFTTPAGHCFVGMAYHNGLALVSVVLYSVEPDRWQDTRVLIDYGFLNYHFREIATEGQLLETVIIENPRLGDVNTLDVFLPEGHTELLSHAEFTAIRQEITFDPLLLADHDGNYTMLRAPIENGEAVGVITFQTGNNVIFHAPVIAGRQVYERTFDSDMDYYIEMILDNIFTRRALPYWFGVFGTLFGIVGMSLAFSASRRARNQSRWDIPDPRRYKR